MTAAREMTVHSVADLGRRLKRAVEGASVDVWVEGEVSGAKAAPSGHVYFCLKDEREDAVIECVMYQSAPVRSRHLLSDGVRVQVRGRATVWAPRGRLQFVGELARPVGRGALLEALENLKLRLSAEGLFDADRKRPLPMHPAVIGVVTSSAGAAIHDIAKVAFRRGGVRILLAPATVQGQDAGAQLVAALHRLEKIAEVEAIILGRGGGSADDLMVFNEEAVVRQVAACRVPVVAAIGHEVDVTLTDLAADARASTPSQAAEMLVADAEALGRALVQLDRRLARAMRARVMEDRGALFALRSTFEGFRLTLAEHEQRVDDFAQRLQHAGTRNVGRRRSEIERMHRRLALRHPRSVIAASRGALGPLEVKLTAAMHARCEHLRGRLAERLAQLDAMSPLSVLSRGYAIATNEVGRAIRSAAEVSPGQQLSIRVHRGTFTAKVDETHAATLAMSWPAREEHS